MSATPNINPLKIIGNVLNKFDGTQAPSPTDDSTQGYAVGSVWVDVTNDKAYTCVDSTATSAVWNEAGGGGDSIYTANGTVPSSTVATITDSLTFAAGKVILSSVTDGILLNRLTDLQMSSLIATAQDNEVIFNKDKHALYRFDTALNNWVALAAGFGLISILDASGNPTFFSDLQSAFTATSNIDTINIHSDTQLTSAVTIPVRLDLTINMNGNRIFGDTTSGDFNLFEAATDPAFGSRKLTLLNGGIIETIGTAASSNAACPFNNTGSFKITNYELGTTTIKSANADCFRVQSAFVRGGNLIAQNGSCFFGSGEISFSKITIYEQIGGNWAKMYKCDIYSSFAGIIVGDGREFTNNVIRGIVTKTGNYALVYVYNTSIIQNNYIEVLNGGTQSSLRVNVNRSTNEEHQFISNNIVINRGTAQALRTAVQGNLYNNYFYSENNQAVNIFVSSKSMINNICITNSATHNAIFDYGNTIISNNQVICINPSHTGEPIYAQAGSKVYNNTIICNNASTSHIKLNGNASIANNTMSEVGAGIDLDGNTNTQSNTTDAYGNIQIG